MRFISLGIVFAVTICPVVAQETNSSPVTSKIRSLLLSSTTEQTASAKIAPSHPVIIRVHEKAFANSVADNVNASRAVHHIVVGTPITGKCQTRGVVKVDATSSEEAAEFLVTFRGQSSSKTIGINGPARIHGHSVTDFVLSRQITFSPRNGFQARATQLQTTTRIAVDDVQAVPGGLRGALVRRIAWRKVGQSHDAATRETDAHTRRGLLEEFDAQLDTRVAELNRQLKIAEYVNAILGGPRKLDILVRTEDSCVQFAVGAEGVAGSDVEFPAGCPVSPLEVRIHESALKGRAGFIEAMGLLASKAGTAATSLQLLKMIAWQSDESSSVHIQEENGWIVVSLDQDPTKQMLQPDAVARRTAN